MATDAVESSVDIVGILAVQCMEQAIRNAIKHAHSAYGLTAWQDIKKA